MQQSSWPQHRREHTTSLSATPILTAVASSGLSSEELGAVRKALVFACQDQEVVCSTDGMLSQAAPVETAVPGATGRAMLLRAPPKLSEEEVFDLQCAISQELDEMIYSTPQALTQPVLISIQSDIPTDISEETFCEHLAALIEQDTQQYEMNVPLPRRQGPLDEGFTPSLHLELDGAHVTDPHGNTFWDTSSLLVFDDLVSDDLRKRLLDIVLGRQEDRPNWDDVRNGPDPSRWVRGGLFDIPESQEGADEQEEGPCWGLREESICELCYEHHDALQEFETIVSDLFPQFTVSRFSEAVLGASVSPLTANAPTHGDKFDYHIDADPNMTPPSPWTDVFGRYPNRCPGKPRFMSCLIYLNDWKPDEWGAPTRFLDVATDTHYDVQAMPGRCVIMDQDITHKVVAPLEAAGKRPRYSLVWKLILHPKADDQDMTDLAGKRKSEWPEPILLGSAAAEPAAR